MEGLIGLPVPAAVEPVPVGLSAVGGDGGHVARPKRTSPRSGCARVVARGDCGFRGVDGAASLHQHSQHYLFDSVFWLLFTLSPVVLIALFPRVAFWLSGLRGVLKARHI